MVHHQLRGNTTFIDQKQQNASKFIELSQSIGNRETVFGSVILDNANTFRETIAQSGRTLDNSLEHAASSSNEGFPEA